MTRWELFIAYVSWENGGKNRPVLLLSVIGDVAEAFPVTTQYEGKSANIRARYFKINDWKQAGLSKQSYVDTGAVAQIPLAELLRKAPIGRLTVADENRLLIFLGKLYGRS
jgi:hypothetical protein